MPEHMTEQRLFSQKDAARYLGISVRFFRDRVHLTPIELGSAAAGKRPLLRYLREELDAVVDAWVKKRMICRSWPTRRDLRRATDAAPRKA